MGKRKKAKTMRGPLSQMRGGSWYGDVWDGIKSVASPVNDFLKKTKIISTVGGLIPHAGVQTGAKIAGQLGYGRQGYGLVYNPGLKGAGRKKALLKL